MSLPGKTSEIPVVCFTYSNAMTAAFFGKQGRRQQQLVTFLNMRRF
jgi:hypothetical protein